MEVPRSRAKASSLGFTSCAAHRVAERVFFQVPCTRRQQAPKRGSVYDRTLLTYMKLSQGMCKFYERIMSATRRREYTYLQDDNLKIK